MESRASLYCFMRSQAQFSVLKRQCHVWARRPGEMYTACKSFLETRKEIWRNANLQMKLLPRWKRRPAAGHWFARTENQQRKKSQNGDVGTFWRRSAIQHREGKAILDASRHGNEQEGMDKLGLAPPLLCVKSNPVLKRLFCNTVSIASGAKVS